MRLSNVLDKSIQHVNGDSKPCVVLAQNGSTESFTLTYSAACLAMNDHLQWLQQQTTGTRASMVENILIAYLASNSTDMLLSMLASTELRTAGVALLNTRWTTLEIVEVLQQHSLTDKTLLLHDGDSKQTAQQVAELLDHPVDMVLIPTISKRYMISTITCNNRNQLHYSPRTTPPLNVDHEIKSMIEKQQDNDDDALIVFTSGTTSGSKGVRLSHTAILIQAMAKCGAPCHCSTHTRLLATVPFFHVGGLSSALAVWLTGGTIVMPHAKGFDASYVVETITSQVTNTLVVVPAMLHAILQHLDHHQPTKTYSFSTIDLILIGGQSASPIVVQHLKTIFPKARLVQTYACTEAASSLTFSLLTDEMVIDIDSSGDCVGYPPPHIDLCLVRQPCSGGQIIPIHEDRTVGIFATKGHHMMNGYWNRNNDHHDFSTLQRTQWFLTNDLGFKVNGQFYFCGRTKDVIRTGGETVIAAEVERVLLECHDIVDCAVFALPDGRFGEAVCAALVLTRDHHRKQRQRQSVVTLSQIRQFCGEKGLASYKRPRRLFHINELPRNSSGKVVKFMLVDQFGSKQDNAIQSKL